MKKIGFTLFILIIFFTHLYSQMKVVEIQNEYIKIIGNIEYGSYIVQTTGGDPELDFDQNAYLTSEDVEPTSLTTIQIDGNNYKFGYKIDEENGRFESRLMKRSDMLTATWSASYINITQKLRIVKGPTTGRLDTLEIEYNVLNRDLRNHNVGIRIMIDIHLSPSSIEGGRNEATVYFKTPQIEKILNETELINEQIPEYWYCFNDVLDPIIKAQGSLKIPGTRMPDKVIFASWARFKKNLWDFSVRPDRNFKRRYGVKDSDSAIAILWQPKELKPNEDFTVKTYYGLYKEPAYTGKVFNISLSGPVETSGEPFTVIADVQNVSTYKIVDAKAEIILPDSLKLNFEENNIKGLIDIEKDDVKKTSWSLIPTITNNAVMTVKVKVSGVINNEKKEETVERQIEFKAKEKIVRVEKEKDVEMEVEVKPEIEVERVVYTLYDFSWLNKIIKEVTELKGVNNNRIDEINELIELIKKQKKAMYNKDNGEADRKDIEQRRKRVNNLEEEIPEAVKDAVKYEESQVTNK